MVLMTFTVRALLGIGYLRFVIGSPLRGAKSPLALWSIGLEALGPAVSRDLEVMRLALTWPLKEER